MYNNIRMRLTTFTVAAASTALAIGLILLLGSSPTSAFRLSEEGNRDKETSSIKSNSNNYNSNKIVNEIGSRVKGPVMAVPQSSSPLISSAASKSSHAVVLSKRSLSSLQSSDPSSNFRSHNRHENSILNVAWPSGGMWGFLPSSKKVAAAPASLPSSLHSQSSSSTSSFNKKTSSHLSSADSPSSHQTKKKSSSDLFLDPVTLDEGPSFFSGRHRLSSSTSKGNAPAPNSFFHSSDSSSSGSAPNGGNGGGGAGTSLSSGEGADAKIHPTPPPRAKYMILQPPTRLETPLGGDPGQQAEDNEDLLENEILEGDGEHSSWLKRSYTSGIVTGSSAGYNKRKINYDVPQIECPPADDGMERFACPSADRIGRYHCVDDHVLCDGFIDCPGKEDEDLQACMFYKTTKAHLDVLADALLRWARGKR